MTAASVLAVLDTLAERGLLRRLDVALARFLCDLHARQTGTDTGTSAPPELALACALLARAEGQGHSCWPLLDLDQSADADAPDGTALRMALAPLLQALPPIASWTDTLRGCASDALVLVAGSTPPRLYLSRYWQHEQLLIAQVRQRAAWSFAVDEPLARQWLDRLFGPASAAFDWQRLACATVLRGGLTLITGGPGTGKTYTAARALALLFALHDPRGASPTPRIALAAPTGKAAARLHQSITQAWQVLDGALAREPEAQGQLREWASRIGAPRTLHALLGARPDTRRLRFDARHPLPLDVLVVDEASMVHLELMTALLEALPPTARLVLLGDKDQLASVEAGAVLGDLCAGAEAGGYAPDTAAALQALTGQALPADCVSAGLAHPVSQQTVMLRESRRFGGPIGRLAAAVNAGDAAGARLVLQAKDPTVAVLRPQGQLSLEAAEDPGPDLQQRLVQRVLEGVVLGNETLGALRAVYQLIRRGPEGRDVEAHARWVHAVLAGFDGCRVLAALREGPWGVTGLNQALQSALARAGLIQPSAGEWYAGRPVLVARNDPAAGVFNGDVGLALPGPVGSVGEPASLRVWFADGPALHSVRVSRLAHVETAYAMTVHKSQGSEFAHTVLVLPPKPSPVLSRELLYTGITRARQALTLVLPGDSVFEAALARRTRRVSGVVEGLGVR